MTGSLPKEHKVPMAGTQITRQEASFIMIWDDIRSYLKISGPSTYPIEYSRYVIVYVPPLPAMDFLFGYWHYHVHFFPIKRKRTVPGGALIVERDGSRIAGHEDGMRSTARTDARPVSDLSSSELPRKDIHFLWGRSYILRKPITNSEATLFPRVFLNCPARS